jgi:hypothetical protein
VLPNYRRDSVLCLKTKQQENANGRTTQRNIGGRRRVEVWRWMYLNDLDLYSRVLVTRLRSLLINLRLPTDYELFRFLPDRKIRTDSAAMEMLRFR